MSLRLLVVGAGHMGALHAEKVAALAREDDSVVLAGISDREPARARALAERLGSRAFADPQEARGQFSAAVVAVPTVHHHAVVSELLGFGCDVLVEKPIAASLDEAESLLEQAAKGERVLRVGHLEWFNSAMREVEAVIRRPRFVEAHRMGPFPARATDVDVVRDLMIHDIDILQRLLGEEPERVEAIGVPVVTDRVDIANARLTFPGGCVANLTASRVSPTPLRKIRFFQPDGYFSIDFLEPSVVIGRRLEDAAGGKRIDIQQRRIDRGDALIGQLRAFVDAVRGRRTGADQGREAVAALRTALWVNAVMPSPEDLA